jgi:signal transduction histidine kinase
VCADRRRQGTAAAAAHAAAEAQEQAAISMERAADLGGPGAPLLRHMSIAARQRAVRRRRWASGHAGGAVPARWDGGADRIVVRERDRIAAQLQDTVVRRAFAASLTLHGAAGLSAEPEVRSRSRWPSTNWTR